MYVQWASTGILFDPIHRASNHALEWFLSSPTYSSAHRPLDALRVASEVEKTGGSVSIFNILPFRRKPLFDIDTLYREQAGMVARRIRRFVRPEDVEEVLHEVFLKAFERRASFRGDSSPVTWLYNIATNHCLNRIRNRKHRQQSLAQNRDLPWLNPICEASVDEQILLEQLWSELSDEQAVIAIYYYVDGLTHREIARITGVSRRTIGNRLDEIATQMRAHAEASS